MRLQQVGNQESVRVDWMLPGRQRRKIRDRLIVEGLDAFEPAGEVVEMVVLESSVGAGAVVEVVGAGIGVAVDSIEVVAVAGETVATVR